MSDNTYWEVKMKNGKVLDFEGRCQFFVHGTEHCLFYEEQDKDCICYIPTSNIEYVIEIDTNVIKLGQRVFSYEDIAKRDKDIKRNTIELCIQELEKIKEEPMTDEYTINDCKSKLEKLKERYI